MMCGISNAIPIQESNKNLSRIRQLHSLNLCEKYVFSDAQITNKRSNRMFEKLLAGDNKYEALL